MDTFTFGWILLILATLCFDLRATCLGLIVGFLGLLNLIASITP